MSRYDCRKAVVNDLKHDGLLVKVDDHVHNVEPTPEVAVVEYLSKQWFIDMKPLTGY